MATRAEQAQTQGCPICGKRLDGAKSCASQHPAVAIRKSTYGFADYQENILVDAQAPVLRMREAGGHRLGEENSADAVAWNVFRSLDLLGILHAALRQRIELLAPPQIYYWARTRDGAPWKSYFDTIARMEGHADGAEGLYGEPDLALVDATGGNVFFIDADVVAALSDRSARLPRSMAAYHEGDTAFRGGFARVAREGYFALARKLVIVRGIAAQTEFRGKLVSLVNPATQPRAREELRAFRSALTPEGVDAHEVLTWAELFDGIAPRARTETRGMRTSLAEYFERKTISRRPALLSRSR